MHNKKAQSQIITTILIILLVLAAIIIVWQVIQGTVEEGAEEIDSQSDCLGLRLEITNIDVAGDQITIRPTKEIDGYQAYVNGAEFGDKGTTVLALATEDIDKTGSQAIVADDEIEVIPIIGEAACPGVKKTAE
jgi:regulatory protein YycI of two-component signal transduction system YycFG